MATEMTLEEYKQAVTEGDAEDCGACSADEDLCLYHAGLEAGIRHVQRFVNRLADDPEAFYCVAAEAERFA